MSYLDERATAITERTDDALIRIAAQLAAWKKVKREATKYAKLKTLCDYDDAMHKCGVCTPWMHGYPMDAEHACGLTAAQRCEIHNHKGDTVTRYDDMEASARKLEALYLETED